MQNVGGGIWVTGSDGGKYSMKREKIDAVVDGKPVWITRYNVYLSGTAAKLFEGSTRNEAVKEITRLQKQDKAEKLPEPAPKEWLICEHGVGIHRSYKHKMLMCDTCWDRAQVQRYHEMLDNPSVNLMQSGNRLKIARMLKVELSQRGIKV